MHTSNFTGILLLMLLPVFSSCGGGQHADLSADSPSIPVEPNAQHDRDWPLAIPVDNIQPWERDNSAVLPGSEIIPGRDAFLASPSGSSENGEALRLESLPGTTAHAIYRIPLGSEAPGLLSIDANLLESGEGGSSSFYAAYADYGSNRWHWFGPFSDSHLRLPLPPQLLSSPLGNFFATVLVHDGERVDVVAIGLEDRRQEDLDAPPVPQGIVARPVAGGLEVSWNPVIAGDLAGYMIYWSSHQFISPHSAGVQSLPYLEGGTRHVLQGLSKRSHLRISALDFNGNESPPSELLTADPLPGSGPPLLVTVDRTSARPGEPVTVNAAGAVSYDYDLDGDGVFDVTGDAAGSFQVDTSRSGIIRPAVRAGLAGVEAVALGSVSLFINGNTRPVASATADPQSGPAPLAVTFTGTAEDSEDGEDGLSYAWDFDGDGFYEDDTDTLTPAQQIYDTAGIHGVKFRATDSQGAWDVDTVPLLVNEAGTEPPIANIQADTVGGTAPLTVSFDATGSSDSDGSIMKYFWDLEGDGNFELTSFNGSASHTYTVGGQYEAALVVEDDDGALSSPAVVQLDINQPPQAILTATPPDLSPGESLLFDASLSTDGDGSIIDYEWDLDNDGIFNEAGVGEAGFQGQSSIVLAPTAPGLYPVTVRLTDDDGGTATAGVTVTVHGWASFTFSDFSGGRHCKLLVVDGKPAISFQITAPGIGLGYVRSNTDTGAAPGDWASYLSIAGSIVPGDPTMALVSGNPAVAYFNPNVDRLYYIRSATTDGMSTTDWQGYVEVEEFFLGFPQDISLAVVAGNPALCYYDDFASGSVEYFRSTTATGKQAADWSQHVSVNFGTAAGPNTTLAVVDGNPAISYEDGNNRLRFVRSTTSTGASDADWSQDVIVDNTAVSARYPVMRIVDGMPAICFRSPNNPMVYIRATTSTGSSPTQWGSQVDIPNSLNVSVGFDMNEVDGNPAVSFFNLADTDMQLSWASGLAGGTSESWSRHHSIESLPDQIQHSSICEVDGRLAIAYHVATVNELHYAILF